jgi:hypothetical protein
MPEHWARFADGWKFGQAIKIQVGHRNRKSILGVRSLRLERVLQRDDCADPEVRCGWQLRQGVRRQCIQLSPRLVRRQRGKWVGV